MDRSIEKLLLALKLSFSSENNDRKEAELYLEKVILIKLLIISKNMKINFYINY